MKKSTVYAISGGILVATAAIAVRNCNGAASPSAETEGRNRPEHSRSPSTQAQSPAANTVTASMVGKIRFKETKTEFPPGEWLGQTHPADPFAAEPGPLIYEPYPDELIQSWTKPTVYWGESGEIVHASFNRGKYETVSLDGRAEEDLRDRSGLAIVRSGIPDNTGDIEKLNKGMLTAGVERWVQGAEGGDWEVEITPVIAEVLFAKDSGAATRNRDLVGQQIPMILVKVGYPYSGDNPVRTGTDLDDVPEGGRIRRTWYLQPYSPDGGSLPSVGGAALFDEPLLKAWKEQKAKKGEATDGSK